MPKWPISASIFALSLTFTTPSYADNFKSSQFLEWSEGNRSFYIRTSVGMAGLISRYNDEAHGICLEKWYIADENAANELIYSYMRKYPEDHPRGIIHAVMKKQCGSFNYADRKN